MRVAAMRRRLGGLVRGLFQSPLERERAFYRNYRELSRQIEETPRSMTIHVLRGELNLQRREYARAKADFSTAIGLAANLDQSRGWLVVEQVMRDRAPVWIETGGAQIAAAALVEA